MNQITVIRNLSYWVGVIKGLRDRTKETYYDTCGLEHIGWIHFDKRTV